MPTGHALDVATLVTWLATEAVGAFMVRSWVNRGGARAARQPPARQPPARRRPAGRLPAGRDEMPLGLLIGHAGLNAAGLLSWILFVATAAKPAAWLALVLMAPAIGLGISAVTIWTPYPGSREVAAPGSNVLPDQVVRRALDDEALAGRLVDGLLERNLAAWPERAPRWHLRPLVPAGHGVLAIATFTLAVLSAIAPA
ncbi:MAG: hypothetical protein J2P27_18590 [Actinobacteria bacterium]|nr:hypothetical protein [Actinomycetota bacterium]